MPETSLPYRDDSKIERDTKIKVSDELLLKVTEVLGVSIENTKGPTPIIMSFHNSPYSGQYTTNYSDAQIKALIKKLK